MNPFDVPTVGPSDLDALRLEGAAFIDVRTTEEWAAGHLPQTQHLPMDELAARAGELDPARTTVVICRTGARSGAVTQALVANGFRAVNLGGGLVACAASGIDLIDEGGGPGRVLH